METAIVFDTNERLDEARQRSTASIVVLREARSGGDGALLITLPANNQMTVKPDGPGSFLEIFVLEGDIDIESFARLSARHYGCLDVAGQVSIRGLEGVSTFLVNYNDDSVLASLAGADDVRVLTRSGT